MAAGSPGRTGFRLPTSAVAPDSRRPRGLTASDRSTMRSLLPPPHHQHPLPSPAHAPPIPRPHIPTPGPVVRGRENRTEQKAAGMRSGPPPAGNAGSRVRPGSTATVGRGSDAKHQHRGKGERPRLGEVRLLLSLCVFLGSVEVWQPACLIH